MTIRTFDTKDRIIIEVTNPTADIKKAVAAGFNVETIKFLSEKQKDLESQAMENVVAELDNIPTGVVMSETNTAAYNSIPVEMPEEIPAAAITQEQTVMEQPVEPQTIEQPVEPQTMEQPVEPQTMEQPVEPQMMGQPMEPQMEQSAKPQAMEQPTEQEMDPTSDEAVIRTIFASTKEQAFNVLATCLEKINAGEGIAIDVRACLAARKVLMGQTSDVVINGQIQADDNTVLTNWNNGLNATIASFYNEVYPIYATPVAPEQAAQSLPDGFEPVAAENDVPFTAPEPINEFWQ